MTQGKWSYEEFTRTACYDEEDYDLDEDSDYEDYFYTEKAQDPDATSRPRRTKWRKQPVKQLELILRKQNYEESQIHSAKDTLKLKEMVPKDAVWVFRQETKNVRHSTYGFGPPKNPNGWQTLEVYLKDTP